MLNVLMTDGLMVADLLIYIFLHGAKCLLDQQKPEMF